MNTTLRALVSQTERLVRTEAYDEAIALCHAILRRYPRYARCYRILGEAYLGVGEHEEAANLFRRALGVDPEDPIAYAGLGVIFEDRGLIEEAIWQLERAFELAPGRDELRRELARLYEQRGSPGPVQLTRAALARLYARGGLWNKAIGELNDLLAREPFRLDLRVSLARTLWRARRREEASRVAQAILEQAPNCLVARLIVGTCWCQEGRDEEGRVLLQGAQELDPENGEAARLLGAESLLPLRAARVDADLTVAAEPDDDDEADLLPPLPATVAARLPLEAGPESEPPRPDDGLEPLPVLASDPEAGEAAQEPAPAGDPPESDGEPAPEPLGPPVAAAPSPPAEEAPPALLSPVSVLRRQLEVDPQDQQARLALAQALVESGQLGEALSHYDALATPASGYLDAVLQDLEAIAERDLVDRSLRELLGDAYARAGRFQEAMEMYRWLLAHPR